MPDLLIRDVPEDLHGWIEQERRERGKSQRAFMLDITAKMRELDAADKFPLLASVPEPEATAPIARGFKFVDFFAGIGGMRFGLTTVGGQCVFSCEWDKYAQKTYRDWHGEMPEGDIRKVQISDIPDHDVLAAGFPCQPFSIAGVSKKKSLGHAHGFDDVNQGNLFFKLANIIEIKEPPIILLENVKNLKSHDGGRTWDVIDKRLTKLGYKIFSKVIDAAGWVPQHRERIYIVGFRTKVFGSSIPFEFPELPSGVKPKLRDILDPNPDPKYTLTDHLWKYLQAYAKKHQEKGNGFGFGLAELDGVTRTLSARYFKDGSEVLIPQTGKNPRRLTPVECRRLMGFPDKGIVVSDTQAYKQFGNAVVPKVVEAVGKRIVDVITWQLSRTKNGCLLKRGSNGNARVRKSD